MELKVTARRSPLAHDVYEFSARHDLVIVEFRVLDKPLDEVFAIFSDVAESTA